MQTFQLAPVDFAVVVLYLLLILLAGLYRRASAVEATDYLLAGRRLTLPAFVASLVSTWYGGILGVGEFAYSYGISTWLVFGVPYYLFALIFAIWFAGRARRTEHYTIPDQLEKHYGRRASMIGAAFLFLLVAPAPYLLMLGTLLTLFFPLPLWLAIMLGSLFSLLYIYRSGFGAVVRTDVIQFVLMFAGFILIVATAAHKFGGIAFLQANVPASSLTWHGGNSLQYILVWYVIAAATLVDPNFYHRCFAARNERVARLGILISVLFWLVFDLLTTTAGLYARALLPGLENPVESYPRLAEFLLPPFARGLFLVALLATIMSTLDSFSFVSAMTLGRDLLWKWRRGDEASLQRLVKISLLLTIAISIAIAALIGSVVEIWYKLGSVVTPALLLPLASSFSTRWRMPAKLATANLLGAGGLSLLWLMLGWVQGHSPLGIEPIFPGLVLSILLWAIGASYHRRRPAGA